MMQHFNHQQAAVQQQQQYLMLPFMQYEQQEGQLFAKNDGKT